MVSTLRRVGLRWPLDSCAGDAPRSSRRGSGGLATRLGLRPGCERPRALPDAGGSSRASAPPDPSAPAIFERTRVPTMSRRTELEIWRSLFPAASATVSWKARSARGERMLALPACALHPVQRRLERAELCFGPVQRCQAVRTALDDHPELQQLRQAETLDTGERVHRVAQRPRRERKHKRAVGVAGPRLNEALALQDAQRLPDRRAATSNSRISSRSEGRRSYGAICPSRIASST